MTPAKLEMKMRVRYPRRRLKLLGWVLSWACVVNGLVVRAMIGFGNWALRRMAWKYRCGDQPWVVGGTLGDAMELHRGGSA